jgi:membrane-associated phospholipid phosphatase
MSAPPGRKLPVVERTRDDADDDAVAAGTVELVRPDRPVETVPAAQVVSAGDAAPADPWRPVRLAAYTGYFGLLAWWVAVEGVPTQRAVLAVIVVTGLLLTRIGRSWRHSAQVIMDWLPFTAVLLLYDRTRGVADTLGISLHEADILDAEKWLFGGQLPTLWLQHHLYSPARVHWYDGLCTLVYTSHFLATPILAGILWLRDRAVWLRYISRVVLLAVAGLITYCLFPEAPPWYAAQDGLTDPISRLSARGWIWLHAGNVNELLARAQNGGSNPVAAMPSLHAAFAVLVAITIGARLRTRWRWLLALYPAAMGFTLVYCGEHYVLDLVFGVAYALAVHYGVGAWEARRDRRTPDPRTKGLERTRPL